MRTLRRGLCGCSYKWICGGGGVISGIGSEPCIVYTCDGQVDICGQAGTPVDYDAHR